MFIFLLSFLDLSCSFSYHDEQAFVEALVFLQVGNNAYNFGSGWGRGTILRTHKRLSCGAKSPKFDVDYNGNHWGWR